ncbi:GDP-mannose 4,6-dehydratase [Alphaproteobacteria bacterium]|nr:GDP-mannose 4,6-dehydratase [Alphaproteobacteria bacterium]
MRIVVTGANGFIGTELISQLIQDETYEVHAIDRRADRPFPLSCFQFGSQIEARAVFHKTDLCDRDAISSMIEDIRPDWIFHLAAESHVDNSIHDPVSCITNNIIGSAHLLDSAKKYFSSMSKAGQKRFRFLFVSTDEIYGSLDKNQAPVSEQAKFKTSSPYSASKAAGNHLAEAWGRTYGLPIITTQCTNNYGSGQHPEKLIPRMVAKAIAAEELPIFGDGKQIRDWIHVSDHVAALIALMSRGPKTGSFNIGASSELQNIQIASRICSFLDEIVPKSTGSYLDQITFIRDRPGHDTRYALNWEKVHDVIGWRPVISIENGLRQTVEWYVKNQSQMLKLAV